MAYVAGRKCGLDVFAEKSFQEGKSGFIEFKGRPANGESMGDRINFDLKDGKEVAHPIHFYRLHIRQKGGFMRC